MEVVKILQVEVEKYNSKVKEEVMTCDDDGDACGIPCTAFWEQRLMIWT